MAKQYLAGVFCLSLALVSCGTDDESTKNAVSGAAFLSEADFVTGTIKDITASEAQEELRDEDQFYSNSPDDEDEGDDEDSDDVEECMDDQMNALKIHVKDSTLIVDSRVDLGACFTKSDSFGDDASASGILRFVVAIGCEGEDLSSYDGKSLLDIDDDEFEDICTTGPTRTMLMNMEMHFSIKAELDISGTKTPFEMESRSVIAYAGADMQACTHTLEDDQWVIPDCVSVERSITGTSRFGDQASDDEGKEDFMKLSFSNVHSLNDDSPWYESGTVNVIVNNWNGTVTYSDANTAPAFAISNAEGEESTGSLGGAFSDLTPLPAIMQKLRPVFFR